MKVTLEIELGKDPKKDALFLQLAGITVPAAKATTAKSSKKDEAEEEEEVEEEENLVDDEEEQEEESVEITTEEVREAAQKLISGGKSAKLKEVLGKLKAAKVANIKKEDYPKFMELIKKIK